MFNYLKELLLVSKTAVGQIKKCWSASNVQKINVRHTSKSVCSYHKR
jgi:hypothetical protein